MIILSTAAILPIFNQAIVDYHKFDDVDHSCANPYEEKTIEWYLYYKAWIDTVQWHLEDLIRDPNIDPVEALALKRRIDKSNQDRTDIVEMIDGYYLLLFQRVESQPKATLNTESPAWAIDRLSILQLKIYHMKAEVERTDVSEEHRTKCQAKLDVLMEQNTDLCMWLLYNAHVACVAGNAFGNDDCIRLSYATSEDKLIEAVKRIKAARTKLH